MNKNREKFVELAEKRVQKTIKSISNQGILLAICSKNNEKDVWKAFKDRKMELSKNDFLFPKIKG